ncbi:MAG: integration host factor subunit beta [Spirochaetaceae bacterium]|jgi:integration host factor subunit beta|nr:integration host factor subunit beta [Spirochaetaceae bacterium]
MAVGKFTKAEIIDSVYEKSGINRSDIRLTIDTAFDSIKEALSGNRTVELRGFGTFEVRFRKGRAKARNPRTGEPVTPCPHGIVAFKPGKEMKRAAWSSMRTSADDRSSDESPPAAETQP